MRGALHVELDTLIGDLAQITRLAGQTMTNASTALHQADVGLTELVISSHGHIILLCEHVNQRCLKHLVLQAPVATDLRTVVAAMRAVSDLERMGALGRHVAEITRLNQPRLPVPYEVRPILARMSLVAVTLAQDAAATIENRDPLSGERLAQTDDEVDALRRQIFQILFSQDWSHGVKPAVDAALIGRYYERFADHAVAIARQINFLVTGLPVHR